MFNIGDKVKIIDYGNQYTTFASMYKQLVEGLDNIKPYQMHKCLENGYIGTIRNIYSGYYLIESRHSSYIFGEKGIELLEKCPIKVKKEEINIFDIFDK